ncbi:MAG: hypothetical protein ACR2PJ_03605 [Pseudomonadales bacterium]
MTTAKALKTLKALGVSLLLAMFAGSLSGCGGDDCPEGQVIDWNGWQCIAEGAHAWRE